jgi:hypothetical protein
MKYVQMCQLEAGVVMIQNQVIPCALVVFVLKGHAGITNFKAMKHATKILHALAVYVSKGHAETNWAQMSNVTRTAIVKTEPVLGETMGLGRTTQSAAKVVHQFHLNTEMYVLAYQMAQIVEPKGTYPIQFVPVVYVSMANVHQRG